MAEINNRQSNIELLRIISMMLVLVVHSSSATLGFPLKEHAIDSPFTTLFQLSVDAISYVCVNVFILISGWFGIKPKMKSISSFLFQCVFFNLVVFIFFVIIGWAQVDKNNIMHLFFLTKEWWFVKSYVALYILSPVLSSFCENIDRKTFRNVLLFFYIFQTIYGWITRSASFFVDGFSVVSFIGLYLLSRYVRLYKPRIFMSSAKTLSIYLLVLSSTIMVLFVGVFVGFSHVIGLLCYTSPFVVMESICLLVLFSRLKASSVFINSTAKSCFAVYLLHMNPHFFSLVFQPIIIHINNNNAPVFVLWKISFFLIIVFFISVLIDKVRIWTWRFTENLLIHRITGRAL